MHNKKFLRQHYHNKRSILSASELDRASQDILAATTSKKLIQGKVVMLYMSINQELPTKRWFDALSDYQICVPKVRDDVGHMEAVLWQKNTPLSLNQWGIPEPVDNVIIESTNITTVVVPLLCFDKTGHRVGYGKGYYDRFLTRCSSSVKTIGISYFDAVNLIDGLEATDQPLDVIVTPAKVYSF
jgi:5-formyltetrahydrofolate cyclo-ligase